MSNLFSKIAIAYDQGEKLGFLLLFNHRDDNLLRGMSTWLKTYEEHDHPLAKKLKYVERFKVLRTDN